jgi:hypothetical protein
MLTHLRIKNFKAWKDTGPVRLAPLTVIFGANSAGKSSIGHLLLALQQTARSTDRKRALHLGDSNSLIDLGTFTDCLCGHDLTQPLSFELGWQLPKPLDVRDPLVPSARYVGNAMRLDVELMASKSAQPEVQAMTYGLIGESGTVLDVDLRRAANRKFSLNSERYAFKMADGRKWPLEEPEKFYRLSDVSAARFKNAGFMADLALATEAMLHNISYLGPIRSNPRRTYQWSGDTPASVGPAGAESNAAILAAQNDGRQLNRGPRKAKQGFAEFIASWLKDLGVIHEFEVRPLAEGRKEYEVLIKTSANSTEVKITDIGFGVSQVLPARVQASIARPTRRCGWNNPRSTCTPRSKRNWLTYSSRPFRLDKTAWSATCS